MNAFRLPANFISSLVALVRIHLHTTKIVQEKPFVTAEYKLHGRRNQEKKKQLQPEPFIHVCTQNNQ